MKLLVKFILLCAVMLGLAWAFQARTVKAQNYNAFSSIVCDQSKQYTNNANGATQLQAKVATATIYPCGYVISGVGTAVGVSFVYGTTVTTPCDTGQTAITPVMNVSTSVGTIVDHLPTYGGLPTVPPGNNVCILTTAGQSVGAVFYYAFRG